MGRCGAMLAFLLFWCSISYAAPPLAYVTGNVAGWKVIHQGSAVAAQEDMPLVAGDILLGGALSKLPMVLHPLAQAQPREGGGVVLLPHEVPFDSLWTVVPQYVEYLRKEPLQGLAYSREDTALRPGTAASLLPGYGVDLVWVGEPKSLVTVRDEQGGIVLQKQGEGGWVRLQPQEVSLLSEGRRYFWQTENQSVPFQLQVLPRSSVTVILEGLKQLDADRSVQEEVRLVRKAAYLRLVSDLRPGIDLYWLSVQLASGVRGESMMTERYLKVVDRLKEAYLRHLLS
ncbi:hypothetical protein [Anaeroarcus burkinensis]|uniref:hypothetical protein n=1 Tax=Anaeroarcus burkinensis TaxID=82376 RepID=UPI0004818BC4|nr:hypothetical protein [Anaeroarcus burkinensis]